jgi:hypothetical protein
MTPHKRSWCQNRFDDAAASRRAAIFVDETGFPKLTILAILFRGRLTRYPSCRTSTTEFRYLMNDEISLLKARYCRSILKTASIGIEPEVRRLVLGLTTEVPTVDTSASIADAEGQALDAIRALADQLAGRSAAAASGEWQRAIRAVETWVRVGGA